MVCLVFLFLFGVLVVLLGFGFCFEDGGFFFFINFSEFVYYLRLGVGLDCLT